jgi:hypothetical protein
LRGRRQPLLPPEAVSGYPDNAVVPSYEDRNHNYDIRAQLEQEALEMKKKYKMFQPKTKMKKKVTESDETMNHLRPDSRKEPYSLLKAYKDQFVRGKSYKQVLRATKDSINFLEVTHDNRHEMIQKVMTPFHDIPYEEQLDLKTQKNEEICFQIMEKSGQVTLFSFACRDIGK